jgi:protein TonB
MASFAIVGLGTAALIFGLAQANQPASVQETIVALSLSPEEPPSPQPSPSPSPVPSPTQADEAQTARKRDKPSPENLRNKAAAVFAPVLPPLRTPPIVAAPRPAAGNASNTGNADRIGPGQGSGGEGDGTGGGGNGDGGNGARDAVTRPIQIRGKLRWSDLPEELRETRRGGELELTYRVNVDGRVSECRITQSSGIPALDVRTCRLITERFRFRPSRNAAGRPVPSYIVESHGWLEEPEDDAASD